MHLQYCQAGASDDADAPSSSCSSGTILSLIFNSLCGTACESVLISKMSQNPQVQPAGQLLLPCLLDRMFPTESSPAQPFFQSLQLLPHHLRVQQKVMKVKPGKRPAPEELQEPQDDKGMSVPFHEKHENDSNTT